MSASIHTLSNASKGLFRRAICQSGVAPSPYATKSLQAARETLSSQGNEPSLLFSPMRCKGLYCQQN